MIGLSFPSCIGSGKPAGVLFVARSGVSGGPWALGWQSTSQPVLVNSEGVKLAEALKQRNLVPKDAPPYNVFLACGIAPLHLLTFAQAHIQRLLPSRRVAVETGLYNDLPNTLERVAHMDSIDGTAIVMEWSDLDVRLGYRSAGKWGNSVVADTVQQCRHILNRLSKLLGLFPPNARIVVVPPAMTCAPAFGGPAMCASMEQLEVECALSEFLRTLAARPGLTVVDTRRLCVEVGTGSVYDARSDLATGFPYTLDYAERVGAAIARLLCPGSVKKGIITDLDDTMWHGIAGDDGPDAVSWSLEEHQSIHGRYQRVLASLAEQGTLLAAASKNDAQVVEAVFQRQDILLDRNSLFPVEANWGPKSEAIGRILEAWNLGSESVVFIDDNEMEIAEVQRVYPNLVCLRFPKGNARVFTTFIHQLLDLCGRVTVTDEDRIRAVSIRNAAGLASELSASATATDAEEFYRSLKARIRFDLALSTDDSRVVELVNKTNQFNLNGRRYSTNEWHRLSTEQGRFIIAVGYEDRFGPLGKISIISGRRENDTLFISTWVMSCRAFSRRIEYQCCQFLFEYFSIEQIRADFVATERNGPMKGFLDSVGSWTNQGEACLTLSSFSKASPNLYAEVVVVSPTPA